MSPVNQLSNIQTQGTPVIDGNVVTFVWEGKTPPKLAGDFTDWERGIPVSLAKAGRNLWSYRHTFPRNAYIEYTFLDGEQRLLDPLNPRTTPNGFGEVNNYFYMPEAAPTPFSYRQKGVSRGRLTRHSVNTWHLVAGDQRAVYLYHPATSEPCPLLVVYDGNDFLRRGALVTIIDNLIHQERIRPIAMALIANSRIARAVEYTCSESSLGFVRFVILPLAQQQLNLIDPESAPGLYAVMGASLGGLMAIYTAIRAPEYFGSALCLSGGFSLSGHDSVVFDLVEKCEVKPMDIWMTVGSYDFQILLESNRRLSALLAARGHDITYREYPAGHNYPAWRDEVWRGLEHIFRK